VKTNKEYWGAINYQPKNDYPERPFMVKTNKSIDATDELIELICETVEEDNGKENDVVYMVALTVLVFIAVAGLLVAWEIKGLWW